jgi:putative FmdB family regulatory protein
MPSYDYQCDRCGHREERSHSWRERLLLDCPHGCGKLRWCFPAPALHTDTEFMAGRSGKDVKGNKFYSHQLQAWIGSRGDVKRICQERGLGCEGMVDVEAPAVIEPKKPYRVAPDIIEHEIEDMCEEQGITEMRRDDYESLKEQLTIEHSGTL